MAAPAEAAGATREQWAWQCTQCQRECVPIRAESRCLCGHRLKDHGNGHSCTRPGCSCLRFNFIVAEGSWVLRCRCKHKHTDHSPVDPNNSCCVKPSCDCKGFVSPWVCNCDHAWVDHQQVLVTRQVLRLGDMQAQQAVQEQAPPATAADSSNAAAAAAAAAAAPAQQASPAAAGMLGGPVAAAAGAARMEVLLAATDLSCEVNRWDLLQRGKGAA